MENKEKKRERKSGLAFHCHHEVLVEYVWDYDERVDYIKRNKLASEVDLRLRLFQLIPTSKLPDELNKALAEYDKAWAEYDKALAKYNKAWAEFDKALAEYDKAWAEYDKALAEYDKAQAEFDKARVEYDKAWAEYDKALAKYNKARVEYDKAWAEYDKALAKYNKARAEYDKALNLAMPILKQLHTQLCPDCPWTGKTIFPGDY